MSGTLEWPDWVIIACTLLISSIIGLYYRFTGGRQKTTEEFFNANRDMSVTTIAIGLMVSLLSAVSLLGVSSEIYVYGTHYFVIVLGYTLATPFIAYFYLPVFFKFGATSSFQYLEKRFGSKTRLTASSIFLLQFLLYTGVVMYAPALALKATTGLDATKSVIIIGIVCTFYTTIGGIKAVLITDLFQGILMILSVIIVCVNAIVEADGIGGIWEIAEKGKRIDFYNTSIDPTSRHTWWSLTIGGFFTYLHLYGINQVQVQRMLTLKTLKKAQAAVWWTLPITVATVLGMAFSGLALYSQYHKCDPKASHAIDSNDQLMPYYIMQNLSKYPGIPGLFIAGIFSAGLSTVSAVENSVAAIIFEDYVKKIYLARGKVFSERQASLISKILAFIVGLLCLGIALIAEHLGNLLQASLTIFGVAGGPLLGVYTLGMFFESTEETGSMIGLILSTIFTLWIGFGQPKPLPTPLSVDVSGCYGNVTIPRIHADGDDYFYLYRISYMWYSTIGFLSCVIIGLLASFIVNSINKKGNYGESDPDLFTPFVADRIRRRRKIPDS